MKYVKMLGLAAVAAMALMAFVGAGSASATVLCTTNTEPCAGTAWRYTGEIAATLDTKSAILEVSGITEDTCTTSTVNGTPSGTGSSTATETGPISSLTFGSCTNTTNVIKGGSLEIHGDTGDGGNGILTSKGAEVTVVAFGAISCVAKTGTAGVNLGTMHAGTGTMTINATIPLSGFLCPSSAQWTAEYDVTTPSSIYVETS